MIAAALKGVLSDRQRASRIHAVSGIVEASTTKAAISAVRQFSDVPDESDRYQTVICCFGRSMLTVFVL